MNDTPPAAFLGTSPAGFAIVCAWHDQATPGAKAEAEAFAHARGLVVTHSACPACRVRMLEEIACMKTEAQYGKS